MQEAKVVPMLFDVGLKLLEISWQRRGVMIFF